MLAFQNDSRWVRLIWLLVGLVGAADFLLLRSFDLVYAYLLVHFLAIYFWEKSDVLLLAVVPTALTVIVAVLKPREAPLEQMLAVHFRPYFAFGPRRFSTSALSRCVRRSSSRKDASKLCSATPSGHSGH